MIRAKLLYAVLLVIAVLFFVLYRGTLSLQLLIFAAVFPLVLWVMAARLRRSVTVELRHIRAIVPKGEEFQWVLYIRNKSFFATPHALTKVEYRNTLSGETEEMTLALPIMPRNTQLVRLHFHAATCGVMRIRINELQVFDPLRLFRRRIPLHLSDAVAAMPIPFTELPGDFTPQPQPELDAEEFSKERPGDDPSEIFDYHEYREGDAISRIHWKLSSKMDMLIVKEFSLPLASDCNLVLDLRHIGEQPASALRVDAVMSALAAVMLHLNEQGFRYRIAYYTQRTGMLRSEPIATENELTEWLQMLVQTAVQREDSPAGFLDSLFSLPEQQMLVFTPKLDAALCEQLAAMPGSDGLTLFSALLPGEAVPADLPDFAFRWIPVHAAEIAPGKKKGGKA